MNPSALWRNWLGGRKGIRPVKNWVWGGGVVVWSKVQTCIWPSWCHCHSLSLVSVKSRLVLPFWYRLTRVVPEKGHKWVYVSHKNSTKYRLPDPESDQRGPGERLWKRLSSMLTKQGGCDGSYMEEIDEGCVMIRMNVSGWMFLLVPAHPGTPRQMAVKRLCVYITLKVIALVCCDNDWR